MRKYRLVEVLVAAERFVRIAKTSDGNALQDNFAKRLINMKFERTVRRKAFFWGGD